MKYLLLILLCFVVGSCSTVNQPSPVVVDRTLDTRVPRYCFVLNDLRHRCFRTNTMCEEQQFEARYIERVEIKKRCTYLLVERQLLPYSDR